MTNLPPGAIAVIFLSGRSADDDAGYAEAADAMETAAARRDGYLGIDAVRGGDGVGITISCGATRRRRSPGATIPIMREFVRRAGRSGTTGIA